MMNGKPLAELRTEVELGFAVYPLPDGYCSIHKVKWPDGRVEYVYSACDDSAWASFDELLAAFCSDAYCCSGLQPIWTTVDAYKGHPSIDDILADEKTYAEDFRQELERQGITEAEYWDNMKALDDMIGGDA